MNAPEDRIPIQTQKWILEHPLATNLEVPDTFLKEWICGINSDPSDLQMAVFVFGVICRKMAENPDIPTNPADLDPAEMTHNFTLWQVKLLMLDLHRKGLYSISPLPLFAFSEDHRVEIKEGIGGTGISWLS